MTSSPRGFALVISNVTFDSCAAPELDPRKGGEVDDEVLRKLFTELDYSVTVQRDLTAQVTQHTLKRASSAQLETGRGKYLKSQSAVLPCLCGL